MAETSKSYEFNSPDPLDYLGQEVFVQEDTDLPDPTEASRIEQPPPDRMSEDERIALLESRAGDLTNQLYELRELLEELQSRPGMAPIIRSDFGNIRRVGDTMFIDGDPDEQSSPWNGPQPATSPEIIHPFQLTTVPNLTSVVDPAENRFFVRWGHANRVIPSNIDNGFTVSADTWFFLRLVLAPNSQLVTSCSIVTGSSATDFTDGSWGSGGEPPTPFHWPIGHVAETDTGIWEIAGNNKGGSLSVSVVTGAFSGGGSNPISSVSHMVIVQS